MTFDQCCEYLANKPEAQLSFPFDQDVHVYKVCNKMFALISSTGNKTPNNPEQVAQMNLKCDPFHAQELRDVFSALMIDMPSISVPILARQRELFKLWVKIASPKTSKLVWFAAMGSDL